MTNFIWDKKTTKTEDAEEQEATEMADSTTEISIEKLEKALE